MMFPGEPLLMNRACKLESLRVYLATVFHVEVLKLGVVSPRLILVRFISVLFEELCFPSDSHCFLTKRQNRRLELLLFLCYASNFSL